MYNRNLWFKIEYKSLTLYSLQSQSQKSLRSALKIESNSSPRYFFYVKKNVPIQKVHKLDFFMLLKIIIEHGFELPWAQEHHFSAYLKSRKSLGEEMDSIFKGPQHCDSKVGGERYRSPPPTLSDVELSRLLQNLSDLEETSTRIMRRCENNLGTILES